MAFWWVNQGQTYKQEVLEGSYMWAPQVKDGDRKLPHWESMRFVRPGDWVFSYAGGSLRAVGLVTSMAMPAPKPSEFAAVAVGAEWGHQGLRVSMTWQLLEKPVLLRDVASALKPLLPSRNSPINSAGRVNQGYLYELGDEAGEMLLHRLAPLSEHDERSLRRESQELEAEVQLSADSSVSPTDRLQITKARIGQGEYRIAVLRVEASCRVTQVANPDYLRASHIWPWRFATNQERLDQNNGLMLAPSIDFLFDRGLISFSDDGELLVSTKADRLALDAMRVPDSLNVGTFREGQRTYLKRHRDGFEQRPPIFLG